MYTNTDSYTHFADGRQSQFYLCFLEPALNPASPYTHTGSALNAMGGRQRLLGDAGVLRHELHALGLTG
ncbi:MAG TPA: hypothetical protein VFM05_10875 [Candidatus Saccharimonadales bacterium]|nr:hypothetical protein [Candidatus Saccharimonadales bacterium]